VALAGELAAEAQATGDAVAESMASQAQGMALRDRGELDRSQEALVRSVALAVGVGDRDQAVRARTSLVGLHLIRGDLRAATDLGRSTLRMARGLDAARLEVQLADIAARKGQPRVALTVFDRSEPVLESAGDEVWLARLRVNRAIVLAQLGRLTAAERDLERGAKVLRGGTSAAHVAINRAWLASLSADVPRALARYDDALAAARTSGAPIGLVLRDRAELLSAVGLWAEACDVAQAAVDELDRASPVCAADARLVLADAQLGAERAADAAATAQAAVTLFTAQERPTWAARAHVAWCRAALASGEPARMGKILDAITVLQRAGLSTETSQARSLAARMALASNLPVPTVLLPLAPVAGPPWVRAEAWLAEAERRRAGGDRKGARRAVIAGLHPLEALRRILGSVELRAGVAATARQLADLGVALADGQPAADLLICAERRSTTVLPHGTVKVDDHLAEALATLRVTVQALANTGTGGGATEPAAVRAVAQAEAGVRNLARQAEVTSSLSITDSEGPLGSSGRRLLTELLDAGGDWAVVRFVSCGPLLAAVVIAGRRTSRHQVMGSAEVAGAAQRLRFGLARMAAGGAVGARARRGVETVAAALDEQLFGRIRRRLGDRPLVIVPDGPLESMPWRALPSLAGVPFCVAPSAAAWIEARRRPVAHGDAVFVAGPGLPGAEAEATAAAAAWGAAGARLMLGSLASGDSVRTALNGATHAHFACHGQFRSDNPLFSSLALADGPLTVVDLDLLDQAPSVVLLAACDSGLGRSASGAEVLGMAAGFLAAGARTALASVIPVADTGIAPLTVALTSRIGAGASPATALAEVTAPALASDDPSVVAAGQGLCCFGTG